MTQKQIQEAAIIYAKAHKKRIAQEITNPEVFLPSEKPVSVFMAGSPGAGKTEFSKSLLESLERQERRSVRIDGDDLRSYLPGYTGSNSKLFQGAISVLVEKIHDEVLKNKQNFILDGTLFSYEKAKANILRSLRKDRIVFIFYVYQKPEVAWTFTQAREAVEGRNIPKSTFIDQFFAARKTVNRIRSEFGVEVSIYLVKKDFEKNTVESIVEILPGASIDQFISEFYTKNTLKKAL